VTRSTSILLVGGIVAAPLFVALWALQAFTREGFRPTFHPLSLLALGDGGWVQIANFVVTGILLIGTGIGLRRASERSAGSTWTAVLVALMGVGLVIAGVFVVDAGAGFPAGAPEGAPEYSWHGIVHEVGFILTQLAFVALTILVAARFARGRQWGWMIAGLLVLVVAVGVVPAGPPETMAIRMLVSAAIELGFVAVLAARALRAAGRASA
jgi:hypothetical membrane protein